MASPAPKLAQETQDVPVDIIGSNTFGRYPKISVSQTWNMIISDGAMVPYAGYKNRITLGSGVGRGSYASSRRNIIIAVWGTEVYRIESSLSVPAAPVGLLATANGSLFFAENNNAEIAITDGHNIYIYNWSSGAFSVSTIDFALPAGLTNPGYIAFQNGRFITVNTSSNAWYLSAPNAGTNWTTLSYQGVLSAKPDLCQAAVPTPGGGNNLLLFGHNVVEQWQDTGAALFPYQRSSTFNVDYGTLNASTIATLDTYVVWLAGNELSGATLMVFDGRSAKTITTDGINFKLANLTNPSNCFGFLFRQDGHVIYQFTFPDDNLSYIYDVTSDKFFTASDENSDYHIALNVVFLDNAYYFVSAKGANLFEFDTVYTNYEYSPDNIQQIPRLRVTSPIRLPSQRNFIVKSLAFTIENGQPNTFTTISDTRSDPVDLAAEDDVLLATEDDVILAIEYNDTPTFSFTYASEVVDLSISRDGGESFGNSYRKEMNRVGKRRNRFIYQRLGQANDCTFQLKFIGFGRFVIIGDGVAEVYL